MSEGVKKSFIIIVIVIVLFGIIWLVYDMVKEKPADTKVSANLTDGNTGLDNIINILFENNVENEVIENSIEDTENETVENTMIENDIKKEDSKKEEKNNKNTMSSGSTTDSVTSREEKAVQLAKKEWGSTEGVNFFNESIDSKGRYIISVRDKKTTLLAVYIVDVDKQLVTLKEIYI